MSDLHWYMTIKGKKRKALIHVAHGNVNNPLAAECGAVLGPGGSSDDLRDFGDLAPICPACIARLRPIAPSLTEWGAAVDVDS